MKKVYEAFEKESDKTEEDKHPKEGIIDVINDYRAFELSRQNEISIKDFVLITRVNELPENNKINAKFTLNAIENSKNSENEILIFEPLQNQSKTPIEEFSPNSTKFQNGITLSKDAIFLFPKEKYIKMASRLEGRRKLRNLNIRLYEGNEKLAFKMLMQDNGYIFLNLNKKGFEKDEKNHADLSPYIDKLTEICTHINNKIIENQIKVQSNSRKQIQINPKTNSTNTNESIKKQEIEKQQTEKNQSAKNVESNINNEKTQSAKNVESHVYNPKIQGEYYINTPYCKMITGVTKIKEGEIALDKNFAASTDIGKRRKNQEDAVLLIKDKQNPNFKMMVVADGMGGEYFGEVASNTIVFELKKWFEEIPQEKKQIYYESTKSMKEDLLKEIQFKIQPAVEYNTGYGGGSTLVCAIIGKNDTIISNVGDSGAYISKNGKITRISRDDSITQINVKQGKIPAEVARFDEEGNMLIQSIGMDRNRLKIPYTTIIKNNEYDNLMLFTDGITDCLSEKDIEEICQNADRSVPQIKVAQKFVERAIANDSILPQKYLDYNGLNLYIPGGKDNATAAVYANKNDDKER